MGSIFFISAAENPLSINEIEIAMKNVRWAIIPNSCSDSIRPRIIPTINVAANEEKFSITPHRAPFTALSLSFSSIVNSGVHPHPLQS